MPTRGREKPARIGAAAPGRRKARPLLINQRTKGEWRGAGFWSWRPAVCFLLVLVLGTACAQGGVAQAVPPTAVAGSPLPATAARRSSTPTAAPSATAVPPTATPIGTATPAIEMATSAPPSGTPRPLPPLQPLADAVIVDRPLRNVRAVTDDSRQYRVAAWAPDGPWVALLPQDGPGLDLVDLRTGEVTAVVTGTYVLEPQWTDEGDLLIHRAEGGVDSLWLYDPEAGFEATPLVEGPPLASPSLMGGTLAISRDRSLVVCPDRCAGAPIVMRAEAALVTAPGPEGSSRGLLAWTPVVTDLEDVQTLVGQIPEAPDAQPPASWTLSETGEGLWLPRWSPDGSRIALTSVEGRIAVAAADGSTRYDLGPGDAPAWSPDGTLIVYAGASAGLDYTTRDVHLVRSDGSGRRIRMTDAGEDQLYVSPSWSPDGKQLAFVELDTGQLYIGDVPLP